MRGFQSDSSYYTEHAYSNKCLVNAKKLICINVRGFQGNFSYDAYNQLNLTVFYNLLTKKLIRVWGLGFSK